MFRARNRSLNRKPINEIAIYFRNKLFIFHQQLLHVGFVKKLRDSIDLFESI